MTTISNFFRYRINGVVDTNNSVMTNMEQIANTAGAWISYDSLTGKWGVVINKVEGVTAAFDDSNIIGSISVSGTGLMDYYNSVEVSFPHRDIQDERDFIRIDIPAEERLNLEPDNKLSLDLSLMNEPIQATIMGFLELRQSRVDLIVRFTTDYSRINLTPGEVISVTNSAFNFNAKKFRVMTIEERDDDEGIVLDITALEYRDDVYDFDELERFTVTDVDGIRTPGAIGVPGTPQVSLINQGSRPRVEVEVTVPEATDLINPTGLVEGMEFWVYQIGAAELPNWDIIDDSTRTYRLYDTVRPGGGRSTFAGGETVTMDIDNVNAGNFLVKVRGVNSTVSGPFTERTGLVGFDPTQVTDAISPAGAVLDVAGAPIPDLGMNQMIGWSYANKGADSLQTKLASFGLNSTDLVTDSGLDPGRVSDVIGITIPTAEIEAAFNAYAGTPNFANGFTGNPNSVIYREVEIPYTTNVMQIYISCTGGNYDYIYWSPITDSQKTGNMSGFIPMFLTFFSGAAPNNVPVANVITGRDTPSYTLYVGGVEPFTLGIQFEPEAARDWNQDAGGQNINAVWPFNFEIVDSIQIVIVVIE